MSDTEVQIQEAERTSQQKDEWVAICQEEPLEEMN